MPRDTTAGPHVGRREPVLRAAGLRRAAALGRAATQTTGRGQATVGVGRNGRRLVVAVVVALLGVAVVAHALTLSGVRRISHDDTISFLAATGHQGEFQRVVDTGVAPIATWVPAQRWQSYTRIDDVFPLVRIAQDLGHHDIHPFGYFWLLHTWALVFGVGLWTGPALNVVLHLITAAVLWRLARRMFDAALPAWGVVAVWASLPAVAQTVVSSRQYSLAALCSVTFAAAYLRTRDRADGRGWVALAAATAAGMLTLYTFGLVVAGLGVVSVVDLRWPDRRRGAWRQLSAMVVGGIVFLACQPWLREALARQRDQAEPFSTAQMAARAEVVLRELPRFAVAGLSPGVAVAFLLVAIVLVVLAWRTLPAARPLVWLAVWVPGALIAAYLAAVSPGAAYEARYFSIAWPFVAFVPVLAWRVTRRWPAVSIVALGLILVAGVTNVATLEGRADTPPADTLDGDRPIVLDNVARGVLLRILWDAPADVPVFVADQPTLLATTDRWLDCPPATPCHDRPLLLTTQAQYEATRAGQLALLQAARAVRDVERAPDLGVIADRYRLSAPRSTTLAAANAPSARTTPASTTSSSSPATIQDGSSSVNASTMIASRTTARAEAATASAPYDPDGVKSASRARYQNSAQ